MLKRGKVRQILYDNYKYKKYYYLLKDLLLKKRGKMPFTDFWTHNLSREELNAIRILEQQIMALDNEWIKYDKQNFIDWNHKFKGVSLNQLHPNIQIPQRDSVVEKEEFHKIWSETIKVFQKAAKLIGKGKTQDAIIVLFNKLSSLEKMINQLEAEERRTISYLRQYSKLFEKIFDNNYGQGYFNHVINNYEVRFKILEILKNEYDLIKYLLSDVV